MASAPHFIYSGDGIKPGATEGGHSGAVAPKWLLLPSQNKNCAPPPNEDCAPKKLTGSGLLECKSRSKTPKLEFTVRIFVIFVDSYRIS